MLETKRTPVFSRYEVVEKVGSGGMGTVYKARDAHLDRWVALKVLPPAMQENVEALERFKREARALARLKHPRVAAVYDANVEGGFPYMVMEYVEGANLEQILADRGTLPVAEAVRLGLDLAEALEHIHAQHIVHRDVKTSNIILGPDGQAVLADFGIALAPALPRISTGALGTPEYMSPEQATGQLLDGRSDIYSLGVVLFECLAGRLPFEREGDGLAALTRLMTHVVEAPAPSLRAGDVARDDVPAWLDAVVARCLAKDPEERFATGAELALALRMAGAVRPAPADAGGDGEAGAVPALARADAEATPDPDAPRVNYRKGIALISHVRPVDAVAFSPDNSRLVSASEDGVVRLWHVASGQLLHTFEGHAANVVSAAFSPDGRHVASGDVVGGVCIWDAGTGRLVRRIEGHTALVMALAFSPDGRFLATGGSDRAVRIWNYRKGSLVRTVGWHEGYVLSAAFSPDGDHLASGGADGAVRIWDVRRGRPPLTLQGHAGWVMSVDYNPDGTRLVSGGADEKVCLWHPGTGQRMQTLEGHHAWVMSVAFSPSGAHVVSAGHDHAICLWDVDTGTMVRRFAGHAGPVTSVVFSPNGRYLASGSSDRTVRLWPLHARDFARRWPVKRIVGWCLIAALAAASLWNEVHWSRSLSTAAIPPTEQVEPAPSPSEGPPARSRGLAATERAASGTEALHRFFAQPLHSREGIVAARGGWTLVVAATRSPELAREAAAEYRRQGFRTGLFEEPSGEGPLYLVGVGQYGRRVEAEAAVRQLRGRRLPFDVWIWNVRPN